jgi:hypothetical protein
MIQSSPAPEEAKTPTGNRRKSDDLLTRFDPRKLDDPRAPGKFKLSNAPFSYPLKDSERVRLSTLFETNYGTLRMLLRLNTWDYFDVFAFGEITDGSPLRTMLVYLYNLLNFEQYGVEAAHFLNFAEAVENGYNDVSYHNKYHAAGKTSFQSNVF